MMETSLAPTAALTAPNRPSAVRAEWTKIRSVRTTMWGVLGTLGFTIGLSALICATSTTDVTTAGGGDNDIIRDSIGGAFVGQIAVVTFAVLAVTSEYARGLIRITFAAMPRRVGVLAAKATVVSLVVLTAGLVAAAVSFQVGQWLLRPNGFVAPAYPPVTLADGDVIRAVVGTALYFTAVALLGVGIGTCLRNTAGAISSLLGLLLAPLIVAAFLPEWLGKLVIKLTPGVGLAIQQTVERSDNFPLDPWPGLAVTFAWAVGSLLVAAWLLRRRDA
jgi:ABC-2 type transport system permease protein